MYTAPPRFRELIYLGDFNALYSSQVRTMGQSQGHLQGLLTEEAEGEV